MMWSVPSFFVKVEKQFHEKICSLFSMKKVMKILKVDLFLPGLGPGQHDIEEGIANFEHVRHFIEELSVWIL